MTPELACVVLSYRDEPGLVEAVQSVLTQEPPAEIVVVNSGGGDPAQRLAASGIDVRTINCAEPLYPGAVRNIGIRRTEARYVAFLAADCVALPGWVSGRLREHAAGAAAVGTRFTNAYADSIVAWASLLLQHPYSLPVDLEDSRLFYGLSYDRRLFEKYGLFGEELRAGEDTEFNARFRGKEPMVRAPDVRTAHRYPTTLRGFLQDARRRGGLRAAMVGRIHGTAPQRSRVAFGACWNVLASLRYASRAAAPERAAALRAWPLLLLGATAYAAGALTAGAPDGCHPPLHAVGARAPRDGGRGAHAGSG